jgi:hypothetical protein
MKEARIIGAVLAIVFATGALVGCGDSAENRTVTKEEIAASDQKRLAYIDSLNIPQAQKDQMKSHMGGPAAPPMAGQPGSGGARK